jgi:hypothetical protein
LRAQARKLAQKELVVQKRKEAVAHAMRRKQMKEVEEQEAQQVCLNTRGVWQIHYPRGPRGNAFNFERGFATAGPGTGA